MQRLLFIAFFIFKLVQVWNLIFVLKKLQDIQKLLVIIFVDVEVILNEFLEISFNCFFSLSVRGPRHLLPLRRIWAWLIRKGLVTTILWVVVAAILIEAYII